MDIKQRAIEALRRDAPVRFKVLKSRQPLLNWNVRILPDNQFKMTVDGPVLYESQRPVLVFYPP